MTLLRDKSSANTAESAVIMALCAVFIISIISGLIIGGLILMSTQIGRLFNSMADCLAEPTVWRIKGLRGSGGGLFRGFFKPGACPGLVRIGAKGRIFSRRRGPKSRQSVTPGVTPVAKRA